MPSRDFDSGSLYAKLHIPLSNDVTVGLTAGYSNPQIGLGEYPSQDITSTGDSRVFFTNASLDAALTGELALQVSVHRFNQKFDLMNNALGLGSSGSPGSLFLESIYDE